MTQQEYKQGMAIMAGSGLLSDIELETIKLWRYFLIDLEFEYFKQGVVEFCKTTTQIYPGTNPPALIREKAEEIKASEKSERDRFESERQSKLRPVIEKLSPEDDRELDILIKKTRDDAMAACNKALGIRNPQPLRYEKVKQKRVRRDLVAKTGEQDINSLVAGVGRNIGENKPGKEQIRKESLAGMTG